MRTFNKLFMTSCFALLSGSALASDGEINISGVVTDSSCNIAINGTSSGTTNLVLPTVSVTALASEGATAGATNFTLTLTDCPESGSVRAFFEPTNVDQSTGYLLNNASALSAASSVEVQITNSTGQPIDLRNNNDTNNSAIDFVDNKATLLYNAQYIAIGDTVNAGDVETQLVYTLQYN